MCLPQQKLEVVLCRIQSLYMKHLFQMPTLQMYNKFEIMFGAQFELETLSACPVVAIVAMGSEVSLEVFFTRKFMQPKCKTLIRAIPRHKRNIVMSIKIPSGVTGSSDKFSSCFLYILLQQISMLIHANLQHLEIPLYLK